MASTPSTQGILIVLYIVRLYDVIQMLTDGSHHDTQSNIAPYTLISHIKIMQILWFKIVLLPV